MTPRTNGEPPHRDLVVVDVETNGLDEQRHQAIEVAWWNLTRNEWGYLLPWHDVQTVLASADIKALQVNRYIDRIAEAPKATSGVQITALTENLTGATMIGSNPRFDATMLRKLLLDWANRDAWGERPRHTEIWHHRLWDLSAYAAGVLGGEQLPGLASVCDQLGITAPDHSATGDVIAAARCFIELRGIAGAPLPNADELLAAAPFTVQAV